MRIIRKKVAVQREQVLPLLQIGTWRILGLVFSGFSFILYLAHDLASLSRSRCRYSAADSIFLLTAYWLASSANCDLLVWW